jgi:hypothetical protein
MDVTFTQVDGSHYAIAISREHGPDIHIRHAPGYDDWLPQDLAQYLVEEQFGIKLGIFGQTAAGSGSFFSAERNPRADRTAKRLSFAAQGDVGRSEHLVGVCVAAWRRKALGEDPPVWLSRTELDAPGVDRCVARLDEVARQWKDLQVGRSLSFSWPKELTVNAASTHAGRRTGHQTTSRRGRGH